MNSLFFKSRGGSPLITPRALFGILLSVLLFGISTSFLPKPEFKEKNLEIWMFQEDFYSFGKRDVYEALTKTWITELKQAIAPEELMTMVAIQSRTSPEFVYMTPLGRFATLDTYLDYTNRIIQKLGPEIAKKQQEAWVSTLNFQTYSLLAYMPFLSCVPLNSNPSVPYRPYVHYYIVAVTPGQVGYFEDYLERQVSKHNQEGEMVCWRVWKMLFGSDVPKYVIALFSRSEEELKKHNDQLDLTDPRLADVVRREREGRGILRRDLSIIPIASKPPDLEVNKP